MEFGQSSLQARRLTCVRGDRQLFTGVDFELGAGDALQVAGTNGSGKTSLLRMLCGLACPADGEVLWQGNNIRSLRDEFHRNLMYLGHANGVKDDLLAWENVMVAAALAGTPVTRDEAYEALDQLGLSLAADLPTRSLSQGQRKRVALARVRLNRTAQLWILDEPFTALDVQAVSELCAVMSAHLARGGMAIYTTHQPVELAARRMQKLDLNESVPC